MDLTGKITGITLDFRTKKLNITFQANEDGRQIEEGLQNLTACEKVAVTMKRWSKKRSLDANAYYWLLVSKIASRTRSSKEEVHNLMLGRYGQPEIDEQTGTPVMFSVLEHIDLRKRDDIHVKPVGSGTVSGKRFTHYMLLRGSHTYNTAEMSILIDGVVSEAKELGIETMTPDELARLVAAWKGGRLERT